MGALWCVQKGNPTERGKTMNRSLFRLLPWLCIILLQAASISVSHAYQVDSAHHTVITSPAMNPEATTADIRAAAEFLTKRPDQDTPWTWQWRPGAYYLTSQIRLSGLKQVKLVSNPDQPAQLFKAIGWDNHKSGEYLMTFLMGRNITVSGFEFYGQFSFAKNADPKWGDQGLLFGSCDTVTLDRNRFFNFGNSALRVTTIERDPVPGIHSFNTRVTNNTFTNIYQISTTSNDNIHGATSHYWLIGNTFSHLRGSVKFASRTAGAEDLHILDNVIDGGDHYGIEINNYNDVEIRRNRIENIAGVAINIYTASPKGGIKGFAWGNNYTITENVIRNAGRGIRYAHQPFRDGYQNTPRNLVINNNALENIRETDPKIPAIWVTGSKVDFLKLGQNRLFGIANKNPIGLP